MSEKIPHYHGDIVRILFLLTAVLSFVSIPFAGHVIQLGVPFEVLSGLTLVTLAGLTNPHSRWVMVLNVIVSVCGVMLYQISAASFRPGGAVDLFLVREACALAMIAALYFSVKTLRAMSQHTLGQIPRPWEFDAPEEKE